MRADSGLAPAEMATPPEVTCAAERAGAQRRSDVRERKVEQGFTLVEVLIAVVLVGILSAVAVVGLAGVTKTGNKSACSTTVEAAKAAAATYYANTGAYPKTSGAAPIGFDALMAPPAVLSLPSGVSATANVMKPSNSSWSVTMTGGGGLTPNGYTNSVGGGAACS